MPQASLELALLSVEFVLHRDGDTALLEQEGARREARAPEAAQPHHNRADQEGALLGRSGRSPRPEEEPTKEGYVIESPTLASMLLERFESYWSAEGTLSYEKYVRQEGEAPVRDKPRPDT